MPFRGRFPGIQETDTIYLDNAATTQKPERVITAVTDSLRNAANVHRSTYERSDEMTRKYEAAREQVASLLNARPDDLVFTSGATQALNHVCSGWAQDQLEDGDNILYCPDDHASAVKPLNVLQEQLDAQGTTIELRTIERADDGRPSLESIRAQIDETTKMIRLTHIHNVYGAVTDIATITDHVPDHVAIGLDASQSIGHIPIDVEDLGVDFLSFSGHKMFGPAGTGGLWIDERRQDEIEPLQHGGGQQETPFTRHMEAGTPAISAIIGLGAGASFIQDIGVETIQDHIETLQEQLYDRLDATAITCLGTEKPTAGPVSFRIDGIPSSDAGHLLDKHGIAVRTGQHCRETDDIENSIRVSPHIYNTRDEIETFCSSIEQLIPER